MCLQQKIPTGKRFQISKVGLRKVIHTQIRRRTHEKLRRIYPNSLRIMWDLVKQNGKSCEKKIICTEKVWHTYYSPYKDVGNNSHNLQTFPI